MKYCVNVLVTRTLVFKQNIKPISKLCFRDKVCRLLADFNAFFPLVTFMDLILSICMAADRKSWGTNYNFMVILDNYYTNYLLLIPFPICFINILKGQRRLFLWTCFKPFTFFWYWKVFWSDVHFSNILYTCCASEMTWFL